MELLKQLLSYDLLGIIVAFAATAALGPVFIPWLHKLKFGQEIREEGPKWHQKKSGTPTMGGIMFIIGIGIAVIASFLIILVKSNDNMSILTPALRALLIFVIALGFGAIGFVDDHIKVVKKRNLGLTASQKFLMQLALTAVYVIVTYFTGGLDTEIYISFVDNPITLPIWIYIPFIMFVMVGVVNAVNLTDGLDGLAASVTVIVGAFFAFASLAIAGDAGLGVSYFAASVCGGLLGFLIYNKYPAKVFMGDTGSLFLGAAVALMGIELKMEIFLIPVGFVYFAETLSVILQTSYFKYTKKKYGEGRRIFKMTPIHRHFEMCGWSEKKIVTVFSVVTAILCAVAFLGIPV